MDFTFFQNKRFFITGHTGFKGVWLTAILDQLGAEWKGYSLSPPTTPSLYSLLHPNGSSFQEQDLCNFVQLKEELCQFQPDIVIHLAAQPLVSKGLSDPAATYQTNVMGTVHLLDAVRSCQSVKSFLNVTTDKVYENQEWFWGYRETDSLNGADPYSNSKSCSELITRAYQRSYFAERDLAISTARAGNVIGGGDFSPHRIVPDCVKAALFNKPLTLRSPQSVRPYQHVLDALFAYLLLVEKQYHNKAYAGSYNIGPQESDCCETNHLVHLFQTHWRGPFTWHTDWTTPFPESQVLKLDCSKIQQVFGWKPVWNLEESIKKVIEWTRCYQNQEDILECMKQQIEEYRSQICF